jgi:hypothetical protein
MKDDLKQATRLIESGDVAGGRRLLVELLKVDPKNDTAWMWLATVVETGDLRRECLQEALKYNPRNKTARKALERLSGQSASLSSSASRLQTASSDMDIARARVQRWQNSRFLMAVMFIFGVGAIVLTFAVIREDLFYQREGKVTTATATQFYRAPYNAGGTCSLAYQYAVNGVPYEGYSDFPCAHWNQLNATKRLQVQYVASSPQQSRYYPNQKNMGLIVGLGFVFGGLFVTFSGYYLIAGFVRKQ